ncbi:MAG TPA: biotin--[acetyl-CoA-carboxylase] ligase [Chloroflexia bacterium]|nr:biotin--[acetyl-CoA-carboxylase] ligase [Chloroflexia bacterium]
MTQLTPEGIAAQLSTRSFGRVLEYLPQTGSTNDVAREQARAGAPEGLLVVTDEQLRGRGRRGRIWTAPPGSAILASVVLRPQTPLAEAFAPTMIFALAVRAAARAWGAPAGLKWPNDVLCRGRKLAGILCEMPLTGGVAEFVVAGFGVNVDLDPESLGPGVVATSLRQEIAGPLPARAAVLARILAEAETRYARWQAGGYAAIWAEWRDALTTLGSYVRIDPGDGALIEGTALQVGPDGTLFVRTAAGEQAVIAGTVLF